MVHTMATCGTEGKVGRDSRGHARYRFRLNHFEEEGTCLFNSGLCFLVPCLVPPHCRIAAATADALEGTVCLVWLYYPSQSMTSAHYICRSMYTRVPCADLQKLL